jgi:hypothetical protein
METQGHGAHQGASEISGKEDSEGTPPPFIIVRCKRREHIKAPYTAIPGDTQQHTDRDTIPGPHTAYGDRQACAHLFKQMTIDTQLHIHKNNHGMMHIT